jgi:hypothetical protein
MRLDAQIGGNGCPFDHTGEARPPGRLGPMQTGTSGRSRADFG